MSEIRKPYPILEQRMVVAAHTCDICGKVEETDCQDSHMVGGTVITILRGLKAFDSGPDLRADICSGCIPRLMELFPKLKKDDDSNGNLDYICGDVISIL